MLFLVYTCIEPTNALYIVQSSFAVLGIAFGRNRDADLEARCTGMRIRLCHCIRKEVFLIHPAGISPVAPFTQKHQDFLCKYSNVHDEYLMVRDVNDETWC